MTTLSTDKSRRVNFSGPNDVQQYPAVATDIIYQGAYVGNNGSGYARPLVAGDPFLGIAVHNRADNSAGSAGDVNVEVVVRGVLSKASITGASSVADVGRAVFASDDDVLTLTIGSNTKIGKIVRFHADDSTFDVAFTATAFRDPT